MISIVKTQPLYLLDTELPIEFRDEGRWRSYHLWAQGDNLEEMLASATISEVDQDGGEIDTYGLDEGNSEACEKVREMIHLLFVEDCRDCNGNGEFSVETDQYSGASYKEHCHACDGTGKVK